MILIAGLMRSTGLNTGAFGFSPFNLDETPEEFPDPEEGATFRSLLRRLLVFTTGIPGVGFLGSRFANIGRLVFHGQVDGHFRFL